MVRVRYTFLLKSFTPDQWSLNFLFKHVASLISAANRIGRNTSGHHPIPGDAQSSLFNPLSNWKITIIYIGKHLCLTCHWEHRFTRCWCHPRSRVGPWDFPSISWKKSKPFSSWRIYSIASNFSI